MTRPGTCTHPDCDRTHRDGFKLYSTSDGWRCAEHSGIRKASLRRPLTEREARADAERRRGAL